jgi:hypothetical protein
METTLASLSRRYQAALHKHLDRRRRASSQAADRLGREALDMGLETLDLARIHEKALIALFSPRHSPGTRNGMIKRAQSFFVEALTRIEKTHRASMEANLKLNKLNQTLRQRTAELAAKNRQLRSWLPRIGN